MVKAWWDILYKCFKFRHCYMFFNLWFNFCCGVRVCEWSQSVSHKSWIWEGRKWAWWAVAVFLVSNSSKTGKIMTHQVPWHPKQSQGNHHIIFSQHFYFHQLSFEPFHFSFLQLMFHKISVFCKQMRLLLLWSEYPLF